MARCKYKNMVKASRGYRVWDEEEEQALRAGVKKHGLGAWEVIRTDDEFPILSTRSGVQLKDKWRNLLKFRHISAEEAEKIQHRATGPWSKKPSARVRAAAQVKQNLARRQSSRKASKRFYGSRLDMYSSSTDYNAVIEAELWDDEEMYDGRCEDSSDDVFDRDDWNTSDSQATTSFATKGPRTKRRPKPPQDLKGMAERLGILTLEALTGTSLQRLESSSLNAASSLLLLTHGFEGMKGRKLDESRLVSRRLHVSLPDTYVKHVDDTGPLTAGCMAAMASCYST